MKSLLKFTFICLLAFFSANALHAQCNTPDIYMSADKVGENATHVIYRFSVGTDVKSDKIKLEGIATCYNAYDCTGYKYIPKSCYRQYEELKCEATKNSCARRDGCVVVINPLVHGCN